MISTPEFHRRRLLHPFAAGAFVLDAERSTLGLDSHLQIPIGHPQRLSARTEWQSYRQNKEASCGVHSAASRKSTQHPAWRGISSGHGGIRAAIGFDAGRDAGVAGQRPAPRSALEPESSRAEKKRVVSSTARLRRKIKRQKAKGKNGGSTRWGGRPRLRSAPWPTFRSRAGSPAGQVGDLPHDRDLRGAQRNEDLVAQRTFRLHCRMIARSRV